MDEGARPIEAAWPTSLVAGTALLLLSLAAIASYLDRIVINLLVQPIEAAFGLDDTGFALLQGLAFGLFYTIMALPLGRLADGGNRRRIVMVGLAAFSLFAMACGFARTYAQLFLMRTGVGIGEASLTPSAYSILSDSFAPTRLGRALAIFTMSAFLGIGIAFMGGGAVIGYLSRPGLLEGTFLAGEAPWQVAFLLVGLPGLLLLPPLHFLLREPRRRGRTAAAPPLPLKGLGQALWAQRRHLVPMFAGFALVTLPGYAATTWIPALFIRVHGWTPARIGFWYGAIYMSCGMAGAFAAGWLCDRLTARGVRDAPLKVAAWGFLGFGPIAGLAPLVPDPILSLALFAPAMFLATMPYPMAATAIQLVTPNRLRGQVTALYLTIVNLVGLGLGPILVGLFTDHLFTGPADVRYSLALVNGVCAPAATVLLLVAARRWRGCDT
jgi:MFS family permease